MAEIRHIWGHRNFTGCASRCRLLKATVRNLSKRIGAGLRQRGKQARYITLKLRYTDFTIITLSQIPGQTVDTDQTIFTTG